MLLQLTPAPPLIAALGATPIDLGNAAFTAATVTAVTTVTAADAPGIINI